MIGAHDLGGKQGFGRVLPVSNASERGVDPVEPLFQAEWERRAFALTLATGMLRQWHIDESRHAPEHQASTRSRPLTHYQPSPVGPPQPSHQ